MPQETNLNRTPYFDDYDQNKDFYKVLFKPGYSVQARELTTLQSILQNQIEKFGNHFFKEGARVIPGAVTYNLNYRSVQVEPNFLGLPISLYQDSLIGKQIKGSLSGVIATITNIETNSETGNIILFVNYENSGNNFSDTIFSDNENLITLTDITYGISNIIPSGEEFAKTLNSNSTNIGSAVFISEGVYFIRGYFVRVSDQTLVLDSFSTTPSYRVGLFVNEEIITSDQDESLYDNSRGFSNYTAPGADRLKISTSLIKKSLTDFNDENFIELLRLEDGVLEKIVDKTQYNIIAEELARRTYDESGDYYITPFTIIPKNTLNNRIGNDGLYFENQLSSNGNIPTDNLLTYKISPGKAYIRGFEVYKDGQSFVDIEKPRTTASIQSEGVSFDCGPTILVNNAVGQPSVGIATTAFLSLRSERRGIGVGASGSEIGVARAYDFSLVNSTGINTTYQVKVFDVQTYTNIGLSTNIDLSQSDLIEGKTSGARGYVKNSVSNSTDVVLYNVTGAFAQNESIIVSGISTYGQIIKSVRDYKLSDVKSIFSYRDTATDDAGFNSDVLLDVSTPPKLNIVNAASQITIPSFTISAKDPDSGICTLTSSTTNFIGVATVGNIISYSRPGFSTVTFNKISSISESGRVVGLSSVTSVFEICDGDTTTSEINTSQVSIRSSRIKNTLDPSFTANLSKSNVSTIDTENTDVVVRRQYNIASFSGNTINGPTLDTDFIYQPFDKERYCVSYSDGRLENLTPDKFIFTNGFKNLEIRNLSVASGSNATLIVSLKKNKVKEKVKKLNKANTLIISRSSNSASGVGNTTLNDGLVYSSVYGTRVQDNEISLNVPDVVRVLGIFESLDTNNPSLPSITFVPASLNGPNKVATDLLVGENAVGSESGSVAVVISKSTSSIEIVYLNENKFIPGEIISFKESGISGTCNVVFSGDKNITSNYRLDDGQRLNYYDFSRIEKISDDYSPNRKIKIVFQNYNVESSDSGDVYTVDSYPIEEYSSIGFFNGSRLSDLIDIRPRVSAYNTNSSLSPFEFGSRLFNGSGQSSQYQLAPNETFVTSFSYYQPRIDKLFLSKDGNFQLQKGIASDFPVSPKNVEGLLEVATIILPAYLYNVSDAKITYATHKRYRMQDISRLESRIASLEYYTQLSLLEVSTDSLSIKTNGLDRFKCGFFVDNFKSHSAHDTSNPIFRSSIDSGKGYLRPSHYTTAIDLIGQSAAIGIGITEDTNVDYRYEENAQDENIKRNKKIITLDYTEKVFAKNEFATRIENVTPFLVTSYTGTIELNPSSDTWVNTNKISPNRVTIEGSYRSAIQQLDIDQKTGFSPINWKSWQTDWIGVDVSTDLTVDIKNEVIGETKERFRREESIREQGGREREGTRITKGVRVSTTTSDRLNTGSKTTVTNELNQSRDGIRWNVVEKIDTQMLGPRIVNNEFIRYMRARNIEFVARKLKPNTQVYAFFDNVDVNSYSFPKLLEIDMLDKTFQVGETVKVYDPTNTSQVTATFRVAQLNHKYGPYNAPTTTYTTNPYDTTSTVPNTYTSSTTLLNVDTASLEDAAVGNLYGLVKNKAILVGQSSGARAKVNNSRLVTDDVGTIVGSFFVPETSTISFETGIKKFKLTNIKDNNPVPGSVNSTAEEEFYSQGLLQTSQDTELGIRNAKISKEVLSEKRVLSASDTSVTQTSQYLNRETTVEERITSVKEVYKDPLAQSFIVDEPNGIFVTKLDLFFYAKPTSKIPIIVQLRPIETGLPTSLILPFSEIELLPDDITTSNDGTSATTVTFEAPVFLENGKEYAIVLLSDSTDYQVWISRMGEEDITTRNQPESAKKIVSQQPTLGSLFKSQNGSTWEPSSYDDLKFTLYKAVFTKNPGTFSFYNPIEGGDYNTFSKLNPNDFSSVSNKLKIGLSTSISNYIGIVPGVSIGVTDKSISGNLIGIAGSVSTINVSGIGLTSYSVGSGYSTFRYDNLVLDTITGDGSGLTVDVYFADGKLDVAGAGIVTVTDGGYGYRVGDIVGIPTAVSFGSGAQLSVQQLGSFNTLILDNVQGNYDNIVGNRVTYQTSSGITSYVGLSTVSFIEQNTSFDGYHIKVKNYNHGMYATNNLVRINNVKSDLKPSKLVSNYSSTETSNIQLDSISIFNNFENVGVSTTNPGYIRIQDELISYTGVNTSTKTLTGIVRGVDADLLGTGIGKATSHNTGDSVMKYEFNGVSLRRINRVHNMASPLASIPNPIDTDDYALKIDMSDTTYGTNRINNADGLPNLYFNETKIGSNFNYAIDEYITSSKNVVFSTITPNVNTFTPKGTGVGSRIRTISATSVDGTELSFNDLGFESVEINNVNELSSLRMIANKDNEDSALSDLPGNKSFTFLLDLFTADENVSPVVDMERVSMILTSNRINRPLVNWPGSGDISLRTKKEYGDPHSAIYVSNEINLANSATSLKVLLSAYRPSSCEIKVMYKLIRKDSDDLNSVYEFFPGYENINENGQVIDPTKNSGSSDQFIDSSSTTSDFRDYEFTADQLPEFDGFSIKIIMSGTDQSKVPFIKDLRAIALA